jgi:hypothetical protein
MYKRFYNAGYRISEVFAFSLPDGADIHVVGRWAFDVAKESWVDVPIQINVGAQELQVNFWKDVRTRFGARGVVLVDPSWDPAKEDPEGPLEKYAIAPTEELAIERGNALWLRYTRAIVDQHLSDCQNARGAGNSPRAAVGFTKHCLKIHGIEDPADRYFDDLKRGKVGGMSDDMKGVVLQMQQQNSALLAVVMAMATGQKVDPELLKAVVPPATAQPPAASTSFVATGEIKKPLGEFDPKKAGLDGTPTKAAGKGARTAAATKELVTS